MHAPEIIGESTAITLSLVCALLATVGSFAFFLTRFVTKAELKEQLEFWRDEFRKFEDKLDAVILRELDKRR